MTEVFQHRLSLEMTTNRQQNTLYDTVRLSIHITNTSTVHIPKISLSCYIPKGAVFVKNSVKINGIEKWGINVLYEVSLGELQPGESIRIEYEVVISEQFVEKAFRSQAVIIYEYIYDVTKPGMPVRMEIQNDEVPVEGMIEKEEELVHPFLFYNYRAIRLVKIAETQAEAVCVKVLRNGSNYSLLIIAAVTYRANIIRQRGVQRLCSSFGMTSIIPVESGVRLCSIPKVELQVRGVELRIAENNQMLLCPTICVRVSGREQEKSINICSRIEPK